MERRGAKVLISVECQDRRAESVITDQLVSYLKEVYPGAIRIDTYNPDSSVQTYVVQA